MVCFSVSMLSECILKVTLQTLPLMGKTLMKLLAEIPQQQKH